MPTAIDGLGEKSGFSRTRRLKKVSTVRGFSAVFSDSITRPQKYSDGAADRATAIAYSLGSLSKRPTDEGRCGYLMRYSAARYSCRDLWAKAKDSYPFCNMRPWCDSISRVTRKASAIGRLKSRQMP